MFDPKQILALSYADEIRWGTPAKRRLEKFFKGARPFRSTVLGLFDQENTHASGDKVHRIPCRAMELLQPTLDQWNQEFYDLLASVERPYMEKKPFYKFPKNSCGGNDKEIKIGQSSNRRNRWGTSSSSLSGRTAWMTDLWQQQQQQQQQQRQQKRVVDGSGNDRDAVQERQDKWKERLEQARLERDAEKRKEWEKREQKRLEYEEKRKFALERLERLRQGRDERRKNLKDPEVGSAEEPEDDLNYEHPGEKEEAQEDASLGAEDKFELLEPEFAGRRPTHQKNSRGGKSYSGRSAAK